MTDSDVVLENHDGTLGFANQVGCYWKTQISNQFRIVQMQTGAISVWLFHFAGYILILAEKMCLFSSPSVRELLFQMSVYELIYCFGLGRGVGMGCLVDRVVNICYSLPLKDCVPCV